MTKKTSLICGLVFLAVTIASFQAEAQRGRGWGRRGWNGAERPSQGCLFGPRMANALKLSWGQQQAIDELYSKTTEEVDPAVRELARKEDELVSRLGPKPVDAKTNASLEKEIEELEQTIDGAWTRYRQQATRLLTPLQKQRYDQLAPQGRCRFYVPGLGYGRGQARGPGYGGGYCCGRGRRF